MDGVSDVNYLGQRDYSIRAWLDPQKLAARNMTAIDVANAIRDQNLDAPAGQIGQPPAPEGQPFQLPIDTLGRLSTPEQFGDIIVKVGPATASSTAGRTADSVNYDACQAGQAASGRGGAGGGGGGGGPMQSTPPWSYLGDASTVNATRARSVRCPPLRQRALGAVQAAHDQHRHDTASITISSSTSVIPVTQRRWSQTSGGATPAGRPRPAEQPRLVGSTTATAGATTGLTGAMGGRLVPAATAAGTDEHPCAISQPPSQRLGAGPRTEPPAAAIVRLSDVARVEMGAQNYNQSCTFDGHPSVGLGIYQLPGTNALDVADRVQAKMKELKTRFPDGVDYTIGLRHHAVHPRVGRRRVQHAARSRGAGRPRGAGLPAGLAGHDPADDRRARVARSAPSPSWPPGLQPEQHLPVRAGAGHRHRGRRRHRRAGKHRALDGHRPGRARRPPSRPWRK